MIPPPECRTARASFPDLIDGPGEAVATRHLADCERCRAELATLREALGRLRSAGIMTAEPPAGYWDDFNLRVARRIDGAEALRAVTAKPPFAALPLPARAAALVLLSGAALIALLKPGGPPADHGLAMAEDRLERAFEGLGNIPAEEAVTIARLALEGAVGSGESDPLTVPGEPDWSAVLEETLIPLSDELWNPAPPGLDRLDESQAERLRDALLGDPC